MAELVRRRDIAREAIDKGLWTKGQAEAQLRPWAAIAIRAGADVPPAKAALTDQADRARKSWPDFSAERIESVSRALLADDICRREQWAPVLLDARDRTFASNPAPGTPECARAIALNTLCLFFGLPIWRDPTLTGQPTERKAA